MDRDQFIQKMKQLDRNDRPGLDTLAMQVDKAARGPVLEAVQQRFSTDQATADKAGYILARLGDLTVLPLLETKRPDAPLDRAWLMQTVVEAQLNLRVQVVDLLEQMLDDKRLVPYSEEPEPIEEEPVEERVCDTAYSLLRRFIHFGESLDDHDFNNDVYFKMRFEDRDREIALFKKSRIWSDLLNETSSLDDDADYSEE